MVPPRLTAVTIGARDLARLRSFYLALGWPLAIDMDEFAAFETRGAVFTLYSLENLTGDAKVAAPTPAGGFGGVNLAINVDRREEVDEVIEAARAAGGRVTSEPRNAEWGGRSAYFTDPEGTLWEVAWVPPDSLMAGLVRRGSGL
jgi:catechol 2,3-dioxygenase-like lactoylglutathione lyase family enzyme